MGGCQGMSVSRPRGIRLSGSRKGSRTTSQWGVGLAVVSVGLFEPASARGPDDELSLGSPRAQRELLRVGGRLFHMAFSAYEDMLAARMVRLMRLRVVVALSRRRGDRPTKAMTDR
jgi:hypothetical protein